MNLWDFGRFPKSLLTPKTKLFFVLLNVSHKWHSTLLLSLLTTELVPPQQRDQALHTRDPCALFYVLLPHFFFFSLLEKKTRWLHSLPKRQTAVANPRTKQPVKIKVLGIFPWQVGGREREELLVKKASLCLAALGSFNSASPYPLHADRLLAARTCPARGQRGGKTNTSSNLGRWRGDKDLSRLFFLPRKTGRLSPQSVPSNSVTSWKLFPVGGGRKKPLILNNWLPVTWTGRPIKMLMPSCSHWPRNSEENGWTCPSTDFSSSHEPTKSCSTFKNILEVKQAQTCNSN